MPSLSRISRCAACKWRPTFMKLDPTALRVALRHAREADVVLRDVPRAIPTRVEYTAGGTISALWLRTTLEPTLGLLWTLQFRPSSEGSPATVVWEAATRDGARVTGTLILRPAVTPKAVEMWAEVTVDAS
jgi:hypothetical protein